MKKVLVTGVTGKSGLFFYAELKKNVDKLSDYQFDFIVRNESKARKLLVAEGLNQCLKIGDIGDTDFINSTIIGGGTMCSYISLA